MTKEEQMATVEYFFNYVKDNILAKSDKWPEEWRTLELKWLIEKAVNLEMSGGLQQDRRQKRYRDFYNNWITKNLY